MHTARKGIAATILIAIVCAVPYSLHQAHERIAQRVAPVDSAAARIVAAAKAQIGNGYDADYRVIAYPGGDVPAGRGACSDVVIRALRSVQVDLQQRVHEDMTANRAAYPQGQKAILDASIDHRRVSNLACYFSRYGQTLTKEVSPKTLAAWQPGDIVCWKVFGNRDHIGIVSDARDAAGTPFVIHNAGRCTEENCLTRWRIVGHYRIAAAVQVRTGWQKEGRLIQNVRSMWALPFPQTGRVLRTLPAWQRAALGRQGIRPQPLGR